MEEADLILKVVGALGGVMGTALGIYNFRVARKKEAREAEEQRQKDEDRKMYAALSAEMDRTGGNSLTADPNSDPQLFWWAERMVSQGLLVRGLGGYFYTLPGSGGTKK
jgi:hypothetical protein